METRFKDLMGLAIRQKARAINFHSKDTHAKIKIRVDKYSHGVQSISGDDKLIDYITRTAGITLTDTPKAKTFMLNVNGINYKLHLIAKTTDTHGKIANIYINYPY